MSMFTLAISCLITSNLPSFMGLTCQVPMLYCSLQHWSLLQSPVMSTTGCCFCFGSISSFFLELFLHSSPVAYWAPTDLGNSSFRVIYFFLFILFLGFSRQEYWSGLPFHSPGDCILSELSSMTQSILGGPTWHGSLFYWGRQGCGPLWSGIRLYIVNVDAIAQISVAMAQEYSKYCIILPMTYMLYKVLTFCLLSFSLEQWEYWKMFLKTLPFHLVIWFLCL